MLVAPSTNASNKNKTNDDDETNDGPCAGKAVVMGAEK